MAVFGKKSLENLKGVHPDLVTVLKSAIVNTPIDFSIIEGVRTTKRQQDLYAQGRTKLGNIVTYADGVKNKSNHQVKEDGYGHAVDLYAYIDGQIKFNDVNSLKIITNHLKKVATEEGIEIVCGIDWKKPFDPPHVQLKS